MVAAYLHLASGPGASHQDRIQMKKLYVVRKYVMASSVADAVRIEKRHAADDCWLDDDWKKSQPNAGANAMGIVIPRHKARNTKRNRF
jgi:hypothetical protein